MYLIQASGRLLRSAYLMKRIPSVRGAIHLDRDWGPGDYPRTEEERLAAAKKYNMLPEEYEAYDPDKWELTLGDYPKLPNLHRADTDSDLAWDYPFHQHNYGEPWHSNTARYLWWTPEMHHGYEYVSLKELIIFYSGALGLIYLIWWLTITYERITVFKPIHMPFPGAVHYHYPSSKIEYYDEHDHHH